MADELITIDAILQTMSPSASVDKLLELGGDIALQEFIKTPEYLKAREEYLELLCQNNILTEESELDLPPVGVAGNVLTSNGNTWVSSASGGGDTTGLVPYIGANQSPDLGNNIITSAGYRLYNPFTMAEATINLNIGGHISLGNAVLEDLTLRSDSISTQGTLISTVGSDMTPFTIASTGFVTNLNVDMVDGVHASSLPIITTGTSAPSSNPTKAGDIYVDTSAKKLYFATSTASAGWTIAN